MKKKEEKMKKKQCVIAIMVMVALCGMLISAPLSSAKDKVINWRAHNAFGPGDLSADLFMEFAKRVTEKSGGRLKLQAFYGGEIVGSNELLDAVKNGMIEIGSTSGGLYKGKYPALIAPSANPFVLKGTFEDIANFATKGEVGQIVRDTYKDIGIHLLGYIPYGPYPAVCSKKPIRKIEDFKGMLIRALGSVSTILKELGASTGYIPGSEVYMALHLGTYDAAVYSIDCIDGMKWREVMDYLILPFMVDWFFGQVIVNEKAWKRLPDDLKKVLDDVQAWYFDANYTKMNQLITDAVKNAKKWGYEVITLSDADFKKMRQVAVEKVWPTLIKDARSRRLVELFKEHHGIK